MPNPADRTGLRLGLAAALCAAGMASYGQVHAQQQITPTPQELKVAEETQALFIDICMNRYPDEAKVEAAAREKGGTELTKQELSRYLRNDPGRGWSFRTPLGLYALTVEHPPVRACALRRMTPSGLVTVSAYAQAVRAYAERFKGKVTQPPNQKMETAAGLSISAYPYVLLSTDGKEVEQFILFLTNYHGKVPQDYAPDAAGGVGVEVRLVRQPLVAIPVQAQPAAAPPRPGAPPPAPIRTGPSAEQRGQNFDRVDLDKDGKLTFEEFKASPRAQQSRDARDIFQRSDLNGDGSVSRAEFIQPYRGEGQAIPTPPVG